MIQSQQIEIGKTEKHIIEYKNNPLTGVEEVSIDGESVFQKFSMFGIDQKFEVGKKENEC